MNFLNLWFITTLKRIEMASDKLSRLKSTIGRLGTLTRDVWRCHGCCMTDLGNQTWGGLDIGYRKAWHCLLHVSYIIAFLKMYQNCIISWLDCLHYWKTHLMSLSYMFYQQCSHHFQRKQVTPTWRYTGRTAGAAVVPPPWWVAHHQRLHLGWSLLRLLGHCLHCPHRRETTEKVSRHFERDCFYWVKKWVSMD